MVGSNAARQAEAGEPMETVSSSLTFLYKFIFPTVWSAGFGLLTVVMFLKREPEAMQFAVAWAIGTAFILLTCARLKRVKLDGTTLVISNYRHDTTVPVSEIANVRRFNHMPVIVTITFRKQTPFGSAVTFVPRPFSADDIVTRLRTLAGPEASTSALSS
jgi:hypothetical protein